MFAIFFPPCLNYILYVVTLNRAAPMLQSAILRERKTVRADPRLRTDEKPVRAQSTISYKNKPKPSLFLPITAFSVRMRFSSVLKTWLARAARNSFRGLQRYFKPRT
jgi:hypothetical protein